MNNSRLFSLVLISFMLLAGCVHKSAQSPLGSWNERHAQLQKIQQWQITGKLGVRVPGDNGSANLRWRQIKQDYTIDLSGPLGAGRVVISGTPDEVRLQQANEPPQTAATAEELILHNTGWTIPVAQLTYWVRALPAPKQKITHWKKNDDGHLTLLEQAGWSIQYSDYQPVQSNAEGARLLLPGRIVAEYGEDARLTLIIRDWQLEPANSE